MVSLTKLAALAFAATAMADDGIMIYKKEDLAYAACTSLVKKTVTYFGSSNKAGYCDRKLQQAMGAMAVCLKQSPTDVGIKGFVNACSKYNLTIAEIEASYENATKYLVTNTTSYPGFNKSKPFYLPVKMKGITLKGAYDSNIGRYYNYNRANYYGWALMTYWMVLVLFAGFLRFVSFAAPSLVSSFNGKISNAYRKYITMPALGRQKVVTHGKLFKFIEFVIPTRLESIYIFVYFILTLAFNVANYHHDSPNSIWALKPTEMGRKIADRTGIMVLYIIPQMVLFAGRNNFLQWISGWSYARFNVIHHWMARITFVLIILHAVGMTYNGLGTGKYHSRNGQAYVQWGYVATIAGAIMLFHAMSFVRKHNYEMFVLSHNVLAAIFIAGTWIHVANDEFQATMYATTAIWGFDKLLRLLRMAYFGIRTADVQLIAGETLKVKVPRPSYWKPYPLSFAYIYFFRASTFWQSHPFTLVDSAVEENTVSFYIKVKGGMSNSLCQYLSKQPDQRASFKCSVEGPYGPRIPLQHYTSVCYLSGGNGVPGMFASAVDLAKRASSQRLKFYWVIRHWKSIEWFYEELRCLEGTNVEPVIYVTQFDTPLDESFVHKFTHADSSSDNKSSEKESDPEAEKMHNNENAALVMSKLHFIDFRSGRPDLEGIVKGDIAESKGSIAFVACGHDEFVDRSRKLVVENLENGKRVDFVDTMQSW